MGVWGITDKLPEISRSVNESIAVVGLSTKWLMLCDRHLPWQGGVHPVTPSYAESSVWAEGRHGALLPQAAAGWGLRGAPSLRKEIQATPATCSAGATKELKCGPKSICFPILLISCSKYIAELVEKCTLLLRFSNTSGSDVGPRLFSSSCSDIFRFL